MEKSINTFKLKNAREKLAETKRLTEKANANQKSINQTQKLLKQNTETPTRTIKIFDLKPKEGITSYAQNFEDVILWRALGRIKKGFYIDIGAQHPINDSVSKGFYEKGWRGIHVEPTPEFADQLRKDRPDEITIQKIVSNHKGMESFFCIPNTGLSTGKYEFASRHKNAGHEIIAATIESVTLDEIFRTSNKKTIHWLKIDVEGMEKEVLDGWIDSPIRPWIVVIEATEPNTQTLTTHLWEKIIEKKGYKKTHFDGLNQFYVHETKTALAEIIKTPPNVFDNYRIFKK